MPTSSTRRRQILVLTRRIGESKSKVNRQENLRGIRKLASLYSVRAPRNRSATMKVKAEKKNDGAHEALMSEVGKVELSAEKKDRLKHAGDFEVVTPFSAAKDRQFSRQYAHSYTVRLWSLRPRLEEKVNEEWVPGKVQLKKIAALCESDRHQSLSPAKDGKGPNAHHDGHEQRVAFQEDVTVAILGTVFKQQPEKPSILEELREEEDPMIPTAPKQKYISDADFILLEDETTRVRLVAKDGCGVKVNEIVNGAVCAVKGKPTKDGKFEVVDVIWPTPKPCTWPKFSVPVDIEMVFVSGLLLGKPDSAENQVFVDLLFDYLDGLCGSVREQSKVIASRSRVFFLGDSLWRKNATSEGINEDVISNTKKLDGRISDLSKTCEVFIVPGKLDPGESMMPQPPLHRCLFPRSSRCSTFQSLTNPSRVKVGYPKGQKLDIILNAGENVTDALRNSSLDCPLEMSQRLLQWGHVCPTAPDTLPLHPGCNDDAFIIQGQLPNIFIVGNQPKFDQREWSGTRIVTLPKFSETNTAVILTKEMEFKELNFRAVFS